MTLSKETRASGIQCLRSDQTVAKRWIAFSDLLRSEGVSAQSVSANGAHREEIKEGIVIPSLSKEAQKLLTADIKTLTENQKEFRRKISMEVGARLGKIARHLRAREREEEENSPRSRSTLEERLRKDLGALIIRVQKAEKVSFSATNMIKHLTEALALVK